MRKAIVKTGAGHLPDVLLEIMYEFVSSERLDLWLQKADEVLPSTVLDEINDESYYKIIDRGIILELRQYYNTQPVILKNLIEELIFLGIANIFGGFNSNHPYQHIEQIIKIMEAHDIELPEFRIIEHYSVKERHGWGARASMPDFIHKE